MTREEAIKIIDCYDIGFYDLSGEKIPADKLADAFDMAIEALHREEAEEKGYCHRILPSNVEVVVRCKDCRYYNPIDENKPYPCGYGMYMCNKDDFCSYGERQCNYFGERRENE